MEFDIQLLAQAISTMSTAIQALKQAKDLLPAGPEKEEIDETLEEAERQIKLAESQAAQGLEYELCRSHFPPEVMLSADDKKWKCPVCDNEKDTGPKPVTLSVPPRR